MKRKRKNDWIVLELEPHTLGIYFKNGLWPGCQGSLLSSYYRYEYRVRVVCIVLLLWKESRYVTRATILT
ncbi:hypothetical protein V1478_016530 [Vespula squamosa]|uniref:Uncharacterized protein n=1 Tax=Vespula squamosa TaxID=30214 RepID=A0ABD2A016_VESSQ